MGTLETECRNHERVSKSGELEGEVSSTFSCLPITSKVSFNLYQHAFQCTSAGHHCAMLKLKAGTGSSQVKCLNAFNTLLANLASNYIYTDLKFSLFVNSSRT